MPYQNKLPLPSMRLSKCPDVFYTDEVFTTRFVKDLQKELNLSGNSTTRFTLKEIDFEQDWFVIFNFIINPMICTAFIGTGHIRGKKKLILEIFSLKFVPLIRT